MQLRRALSKQSFGLPKAEVLRIGLAGNRCSEVNGQMCGRHSMVCPSGCFLCFLELRIAGRAEFSKVLMYVQLYINIHIYVY